MKVTIIGAGNMGGAIARGLAKGNLLKASDITCTAQSAATLEKIGATHPGFVLTQDNVAAAQGADLILIAVKPWRVETVIRQIKGVLDYEKQMIASVAAGVPLDTLASYLQRDDANGDCQTTLPPLFRLMPNTAVEVGSSMTFVSAKGASKTQIAQVLQLFNVLGHTLFIEERLMTAGTALASCGIAFALRYIRAAIEGGIELGFYPKEAQEIVAQTVLGAARLLLESQNNPEVEIDKVTTPGGITIKGLNAMEQAGFTAAVINGLKACL